MLRFLGVFVNIAVTAKAEELHCAALRRQRSEVRILSGAPLLQRPDLPTTESPGRPAGHAEITKHVK